MKILTIERAKLLKYGDTLIHRSNNNADGTPMRARVNGKPQTWKTRTPDVRVPMKHGLRNTFQLGPAHMHLDQSIVDWGIPEKGEELEKRS